MRPSTLSPFSSVTLRLACLVTSLIGALSAPITRAQITLIANGQPQSVILTSPSRSATVLLAAQELQKHLQLMSGALVPIDTVGKESTYPGKKFIYVGASTATSAISTSSLTTEYYVIRTIGSNLYIVGKDGGNTTYTDMSGCQPATMFGVYHLLSEVLGVHWLWPGDLGIVAPSTPTVTVPALDITTGPIMGQRKFRNPRCGFNTGGTAAYVGVDLVISGLPVSASERLTLGNEELLYQRRMRMGTRKEPKIGHSETNWWGMYGTGSTNPHPEYFAILTNGSYSAGNQPKPASDRVKLNVSLPATIQARIQSWVSAGKPSDFNICPNDSKYHCVCDACLAWDRPSQTPSTVCNSSAALLGDRYARWYTEVANGIKAICVAENRPVATVYGYAYDVYRHKPIEATVPDNVALAYIPGSPSQVVLDQIATTQDDVLGWIAHGCTKMYLRPNWMLAAHTGPFFPTHRLGNHYRDMLAGGYLLGLDSDSSQSSYAPMGLYNYLLARLMAKPTITVEEILDEYCSGFGSAAVRVRDYFTYWENFIYNQADSGNTDILGWSSGMGAYGTTYKDAVFDGAEKILDDCVAQLAPTETAARARLDFLRLGCTHGRLTSRAIATKQLPAMRALLAFRNTYANTYAIWREWMIDRECYGANMTSQWTSVLNSPLTDGSNANAFVETGGQVVMEAENAKTAVNNAAYAPPPAVAPAIFTWQTNSSTAGAVGTAMQVLPNSGTTSTATTAARLDFKADFHTTGTWYVHVRMPALATGNTAVNVGLDGVITASGLANATGGWAWINSGTSGRATINVAAAGAHVFSIWMNTDGAIVDRVVLSNSQAFSLAAADTGPVESVRNAATEYILTVNNGTGLGSYGEGSLVSIGANSAPTNQVFDRWTGDTAGVANVLSATTTVAMPAGNAKIVATYKLSPAVDTDGDGILDSWETAQFGNLTTANAASDTDGDGMSDRDEYLAGTNPKDPASVFKVVSITNSPSGGGNDLTVQWPAVTGKTYRLLTCSDLQIGDWNPIAVTIPAVTPLTTYTVHVISPRIFFKVQVE